VRPPRAALRGWARRVSLQRARWSTRRRAFRGQAGTRQSDAPAYCRLNGFAHANLEASFAEACRVLDLVPLTEPSRSHWRKSIGAGVRGPDGTPCWMKVSGVHGPPGPWYREGEESAAAITGIPKPLLRKIHDWTSDDVHWRAFLTTAALSEAIGPTLSFGLGLRPVTDLWLEHLEAALNALARIETSRLRLPRDQIVDRITLRFGARAPHTATEWRAAHGDLNWSNVTAPNLSLLDWEMWGMAPRGYDAAVLIVRSCADPPLAARLRAVFARDLDTPSGRVAQLLACTDMLTFIEDGWVDPMYHRPIEKLARDVLRSI